MYTLTISYEEKIKNYTFTYFDSSITKIILNNYFYYTHYNIGNIYITFTNVDINTLENTYKITENSEVFNIPEFLDVEFFIEIFLSNGFVLDVEYELK